MFQFRVGQKVKFLARKYAGPEEGEDYFVKTRYQGSGRILEIGDLGNGLRLLVEISPGHEVPLFVTGDNAKDTYIQPLE